MADHRHLEFGRIQRPPVARRKVSGRGGGRKYDDRAGHGAVIDEEARGAIDRYKTRRTETEEFDPKLILRFELNGRIGEPDFERAGLTVLDSSEKYAAVVFADDSELTRFRERLAEYQQGPRERPGGEEGSAAHEGFFDAIEHLRPMTPADRISNRLENALSRTAGGESTITFDIECWYVPRRERLEEWMDEVRTRLEEADGEVLDQFVSRSAGVALLRCRGSANAARAVAELDQVAVVDSVPQPRLIRSELAALQDIGTLEVFEPPDGAPIVGIIDSGIRSGHPLLEPAVVEATALHPEFGNQGEDNHGHGTFVAGLLLYEDVLRAAREGRFQPPFYIASVRVLDDSAEVPQSVSFLRALSDAIRYLAETWSCRVINLSVGDSDSPYSGGKSTPTAAELDTLARAHDVVLLVSAGNMNLGDLQPHDEMRAHYPENLFGPERVLLDPAQAAIALTVGAISAADGIAPRSIGTTLGATTVASAPGPAPFTRHGPGVQGAIKPEVAADGGNLGYDAATRRASIDPGSAVLSTSIDFTNRLFGVDCGTSFATPAVAHLAGRIVAEYPELSANAIRALLLQGADTDGLGHELEKLYEGAELEQRVTAVAGNGVPSWERCGLSQDNRVVLYAEDRLRPDDFHVYRIPMTAEFLKTSGAHELTVALAYDPPVRHRRFDYVAHRMEFLVVRGIRLEDVYEMASADVTDPNAGKLSEYEMSLRPPRTGRSRGANQVGRVTPAQRPRRQFSDDWFLVVRSVNRWLPQEAEPQAYAVAVALGCGNATNLFAELEQEVRIELEAQARSA